jgi:hypothetical protein
MEKSKYSVEQVEKMMYANNVETQIFDQAFIQAWNDTRAELEKIITVEISFDTSKGRRDTLLLLM